MIEKNLTAATADEKIKHLYETAFPEGEKIPWDDLMRLIEEMSLDFTAYYDGEEFIGFTIVYPRKSINWFWYFAVREELRGKGYGQQILTLFIESYKGQTCVLDIDQKAYGGMQDLAKVLKENEARIDSASWSAKLPGEEQERLAEELIARGGKVNFIKWEAGSVLPETGRAMEHMASFDYGYKIAAVRDWLFRQSK